MSNVPDETAGSSPGLRFLDGICEDEQEFLYIADELESPAGLTFFVRESHNPATEEAIGGFALEAQEVRTSQTKSKRKNRYRDASNAVKEKRRAQNRESQRLYRERKEQRIRDLEDKMEAMERRAGEAGVEIRLLRTRNQELESIVEAQRRKINDGIATPVSGSRAPMLSTTPHTLGMGGMSIHADLDPSHEQVVTLWQIRQQHLDSSQLQHPLAAETLLQHNVQEAQLPLTTQSDLFELYHHLNGQQLQRQQLEFQPFPGQQLHGQPVYGQQLDDPVASDFIVNICR
ncbi:hypothetical protein F5Y17DRAFT_478124 [Xylariaceae sp. FL0594]|nr:hypothetical protein F5Y17DRAFT_478124 [Xylariaceae sp. FL0594]